MEARATFKHLRITPTKARRVVDYVRGKPVQQAIDLLSFDRHPIAVQVKKLVESAVASLDQKGGIIAKNLYVKAIAVNNGPVLKRWRARARGSASRIQKKLSHITVTVADE